MVRFLEDISNCIQQSRVSVRYKCVRPISRYNCFCANQSQFSSFSTSMTTVASGKKL